METTVVESPFLVDLLQRRGRATASPNSIWFLEFHGATIIEPTAFEPDPSSYPHDYYYNAETNTLYKKVISRKSPGIIVANWKKASD